MTLTYEQAEERAIEFATGAVEHGYTQEVNFKPHSWVVEAMIAVSAEAFAEGKDEGYDDGYRDGESDAEWNHDDRYDEGYQDGYEAGREDAE